MLQRRNREVSPLPEQPLMIIMGHRQCHPVREIPPFLPGLALLAFCCFFLSSEPCRTKEWLFSQHLRTLASFVKTFIYP